MNIRKVFCAASLMVVPSSYGQRAEAAPARIPEQVMVNWLDTKVKPVLPPQLIAAGVSGTVVLRVIIAPDGHVEEVVPLSGPESLYACYLQAVKRWTYVPYVWNGRKLRVETTVTLILKRGDVEPFEPQPAGAPVNGSYAPVPPSQPPSRVRVSSGVMAGQLVYKGAPVYPSIARQEHLSGATVLHVIIGKDGTVQSVEPVSGPAVLRSEAIRAVRQWRYKPYLLNGIPIEVDTTVTLNIDFGG